MAHDVASIRYFKSKVHVLFHDVELDLLKRDKGGSRVLILVIFRQKLGYQWEDFDVSISEINLSRLNKILSKTQALNNEILQALNKLSPRGALSDLNFGNNDAGQYASVNIKDLDIAPFKGIPGMRGVDGYLEIKSSKGLFNLHPLEFLGRVIVAMWKAS